MEKWLNDPILSAEIPEIKYWGWQLWTYHLLSNKSEGIYLINIPSDYLQHGCKNNNSMFISLKYLLLFNQIQGLKIRIIWKELKVQKNENKSYFLKKI